MKNPIRFAVLVSALLLNSASTNAQNYLGFHAGLQYSDVSAPSLNNIIPTQSFASITTGLSAEISLADHISFQPEINFVQKGFKVSESLVPSLFGITLPLGASSVASVKYIDVPLTAKFQFGNEDGFQYYAFVGPSVGYVSSADLKTYATVIIDIKLGSTPLDVASTNFNRFELGGVLGGGISYNTGAGKFYFDARYTHGITEAYQVPLIGAKVLNQGVSIGIGYLFNLEGASSSKSRFRA
jgi:hypothetical protein